MDTVTGFTNARFFHEPDSVVSHGVADIAATFAAMTPPEDFPF
jgi:hypothetical protein